MVAPWKQSCDNRDSVLQSRHHFANKGPHSHGYGFSSSHIWMWELDHKEGWVLKNWCFQTVVLRKLLRVPWTTRRSNQSTQKEINPEYSLEGLVLNRLYFGHWMQRANSLEKTLMLGKTEGRSRRGWQRMRWLGGIIESMDLSKLCEEAVKGKEAWCAAVHGGCKELVTTWQLNNSSLTSTRTFWWVRDSNSFMG